MVTQDPVSTARFGYIYAISPNPLLYFCNTNRQSKVISICFLWPVRNRSCNVHLLPFAMSVSPQVKSGEQLDGCSWNLMLQGFTKISRYVAVCITKGDSFAKRSTKDITRTFKSQLWYSFNQHNRTLPYSYNWNYFAWIPIHISSLTSKIFATEETNLYKRIRIRHINQTKKKTEPKLFYSDWDTPQL